MICLYFATNTLPSEKFSGRVFLGIAAVLAVITLLVGWASVRALNRHPNWVREPGNPLPARDARQRWCIGLPSLAALFVVLVAQVWVRDQMLTIMSIVPFIAGLWSFSALARRAPTTDSLRDPAGVDLDG